jgi:hypothetical protein
MGRTPQFNRLWRLTVAKPTAAILSALNQPFKKRIQDPEAIAGIGSVLGFIEITGNLENARNSRPSRRKRKRRKIHKLFGDQIGAYRR